MMGIERKNKSYISFLIYAFFIILSIICISPFLVMVINATRSNVEISNGISVIPGNSLASNYEILLKKVNIWQGFLNSILITVPFTLLTAYFGSLTAYGFAMYDFKFKNGLFIFILATMMIPQQLGLIGYFDLVTKLNLTTTFLPLIIPGITNTFTIFFLKMYAEQTISKSILESARIDSAGELQIFHRIGLPILSPAIATMCIFTFVATWNNYVNPLVLLAKGDMFPLPVLISQLRGTAHRTDFGAMYLAITFTVVPLVIAFVFLSKKLINGLTAGGVKG